MRRTISLICSITVTLAGAGLVYVELVGPHPHPIPGKLILVAVFMLAVGVLWLASEIRQWRH
jgi:hypothetical protein